jgi:tRNA pseudouridine55 synthase
VVAVTRGALGVRRVGHGGTLDPLARGVLPLLVGGATTFMERLREAPKVYAAVVRFGLETTTDDRAGSERRAAAVPAFDAKGLDDALASFRGEISQVPPEHSAVNVAGRRAYARARAGETVEMTARTVRISRLAVASWTSPDLCLLVVCSSGTYVRALARDIGRALGSAAHLADLVRLAVGALDLPTAIGLDELRARGAAAVEDRLRPADERLLPLDPRYLHESAATLVLGEVSI